MINETTNLSCAAVVTDSTGNQVQIMTFYAALDANGTLAVTVTTTNKDLAATHAAEVRSVYDQFMATVETKAKSLGFVIFNVPVVVTPAEPAAQV